MELTIPTCPHVLDLVSIGMMRNCWWL